MIKAVMFDLDGTLVPMVEEEFVKGYFSLLCKKVVPFGYEKDSFVKAIWKGTACMQNNNGEKTNEEVFWESFAKIYGEEKLKDKKYFDEFYSTDFANTKVFCQENPYAKEIVKLCKSQGKKLIVATSPVFPKEAIEWRIKFIGLDPNDFDYVTNYSNSHFCKPNRKFFEEIIEKMNLKSEEVLFFGNSEIEDGEPAKSLGIKTFMVGDFIVENKENPNQFKHLKMSEVKQVIEEEIKK